MVLSCFGKQPIGGEVGEKNEYPTIRDYMWPASANSTYGPTQSHLKYLDNIFLLNEHAKFYNGWFQLDYLLSLLVQSYKGNSRAKKWAGNGKEMAFLKTDSNVTNENIEIKKCEKT